MRTARRVVLPFALVVVSALASWAGPATGAAAPRCLGKVATIVGTNGDDEIAGTPGPDVIAARGGWDFIRSGAGNDRICGGRGLETVRAGVGDDRIASGPGSDAVKGGRGRDRIVSGSGSVEALFGGPGSDRLFGGAGSFDGLIGGPGNDLLNGGSGQDLAHFFDASGPVEGDLEMDLVTGHGTDELVGIEGLTGSNFDDVLLGDEVSNLLVGERGDDLIQARGSGTLDALGADVLDGGGGDDTLEGGPGDDILRFEDSPNPVTVDLAAGTSTGWGSDAVSGIEAVIGSELNDSLLGDANDNRFVGGFGDDLIDGRGGIDQAAYFDSFLPVVVDLAAGTATGWGADTLVEIEDVLGSAHADVLAGDNGPNAVGGGSGDDTLSGAAGNDVLIGEGGVDTADGGPGADACDAETETGCEAEPAARPAASPGRSRTAPTSVWWQPTRRPA
jgi:Ca2+-binding RTX toxin-like protein